VITNPLLSVGLLLLLCYLGGRLANLLHAPRVGGYLLTGLLLGPSATNILPEPLIRGELLVLTKAGMSLIAFSIGGSLIVERIRRLGKSIFTITAFQAAGGFLVPAACLLGVLPFLLAPPEADPGWSRMQVAMALLIGAVCVATASGAVLGVVSEMRAAGPFTTALLSVIALSYGLTILLFTLSVAVAQTLTGPGDVSLQALLSRAALPIAKSLLLGGAGAVLLLQIGRLIQQREAYMMVVFGTIFSTSGVADALGLSGLLANMVVGCLIVNLGGNREFFRAAEQIEEPVFSLFFGLGGAHMQLGVLQSAGPLALLIVVARLAGKTAGTWCGASIARAPDPLRRYLGLALSPQAGWTIGLVLTAENIFPVSEIGSILVNAIIGSVIISMILCLPLVRFALLKAGETSYDGRKT